MGKSATGRNFEYPFLVKYEGYSVFAPTRFFSNIFLTIIESKVVLDMILNYY